MKIITLSIPLQRNVRQKLAAGLCRNIVALFTGAAGASKILSLARCHPSRTRTTPMMPSTKAPTITADPNRSKRLKTLLNLRPSDCNALPFAFHRMAPGRWFPAALKCQCGAGLLPEACHEPVGGCPSHLACNTSWPDWASHEQS